MYGQEQTIKINVGDIDDSTYKKEIIKLLIVMKLINKNRGRLTKINIFTNLSIDEEHSCSIYIEDLEKKKVQIFNILKSRNKKENKEKENFFTRFKIYNIEEIKYNQVIEEDMSFDIIEISNQLEKIT